MTRVPPPRNPGARAARTTAIESGIAVAPEHSSRGTRSGARRQEPLVSRSAASFQKTNALEAPGAAPMASVDPRHLGKQALLQFLWVARQGRDRDRREASEPATRVPWAEPLSCGSSRRSRGVLREHAPPGAPAAPPRRAAPTHFRSRWPVEVAARHGRASLRPPATLALCKLDAGVPRPPSEAKGGRAGKMSRGARGAWSEPRGFSFRTAGRARKHPPPRPCPDPRFRVQSGRSGWPVLNRPHLA